MTLTQRKSELTNWIHTLENETLIQEIEKLKQGFKKDLPKEISELLELSDKTLKTDCIEHKNVRDLLRKGE